MVDFSEVKGIPDYFLLKRYDIKPDDICRLFFKCEPQDIQEGVIITPLWLADIWADIADNMITIFENLVYTLSYHDKKFTFIRSGMGASQAGDLVLALSCTPCHHIIFTGSFGGLTDKLKIGDFLTITESMGGDGYSSYLVKGKLSQKKFLKSTRPHTEFNKILKEYAAKEIAKEKGIALHEGRIFSTDTIIGQFQHLDMITGKLGCVGIEMETSAVFNAAALTGMPATALLLASDVIATGKSLFSGRTIEEKERYQKIKRTVLSKIILETLSDKRLAEI
jgi:purine-nucleoside phosphorylase